MVVVVVGGRWVGGGWLVSTFHGEPTYIFTGPLVHTMIRACARRGVGCASTGRARRPWVMMAEGAGGRMREGRR